MGAINARNREWDHKKGEKKRSRNCRTESLVPFLALAKGRQSHPVHTQNSCLDAEKTPKRISFTRARDYGGTHLSHQVDGLLRRSATPKEGNSCELHGFDIRQWRRRF